MSDPKEGRIFRTLCYSGQTGASGQLKGGRHIRYSKDTPMPNLMLTMLDKLGVHVGRLRDNTGKLNLLTV